MWIKHDPTKVFQYLSTGYELLWRTCLSFYWYWSVRFHSTTKLIDCIPQNMMEIHELIHKLWILAQIHTDMQQISLFHCLQCLHTSRCIAKIYKKPMLLGFFHSVIAAKAWFQSKELENEHFTQIYELVNYLDTPPPVPYWGSTCWEAGVRKHE